MSIVAIEEQPVWELSYERRVREIRHGNRTTVMVVAGNLSDAVTAAAAHLGDAWVCWSARHVGRRVVIGAAPTGGVEK